MLVVLAACGGKEEVKDESSQLKVKLDALKKTKDSLNQAIAELEEKIKLVDPAAAKADVVKLVEMDVLQAGNFNHYIDLQGKVISDDVFYVSPRNGVGGQVKAIYIKQGDYVKKGQLVLKLDDAAYLKGLKTLETQLQFAEDVYQRQQNLWKQNIGREIDVLSAKNNVDRLKDEIASTKEQWSMTSVYAEVSGIVEQMNVRVGELFTGRTLGDPNPQIGIVNTSALKVQIEIPETYSSRIHKGSSVQITLPDINQSFSSVISLTGNVLNVNSRSFTVEAVLPNVSGVRPNMIAFVKILDYSASNAIAIPINVLQTDEKGKYVLAGVMENGKTVARKKQVTIGELYDDKIEIRAGLQPGDQLITKGYESVYDGQFISTLAN
jgi:RND family efflux transporter MFP subunit